MKKIFIIILFALTLNNQCYPQVVDIKSDTAVYQCLLKKLGVNDTIPIFYKASVYAFKTSNFQKIPLDKWRLVGNHIDAVEGMKFFLDKIDINNLTEYELAVKIGKHPLKNPVQRSYVEQVRHPQSILTFSPVIYSTDKRLALCSVDQYFGIDASEHIYFLIFKNGKWELVGILGVWFT